MTEKTYKERFADWFDEQREKGMIDFKPSFNHDAIAEKFGAELHRDEFGFFSHLDFSKTKYTTILHPEVQEYIYEGLYNFVTAPSVRIRNHTDKWGNLLDPNHPDHSPIEKSVEHALLCRRMDTGVSSRYEVGLVLDGHLEPAPGRTVEDYEAKWKQFLIDYEEKHGVPWPHPRDDDKDPRLDGDLEVEDIV